MRLTIAKIREIGSIRFAKPLSIPTEDNEIREYVVAFNDMAENLRGHIERQRRFISDASHELVTPITVINGHADMLLRRGKEQPELLETGLEIIKAEALRMDGLVSSLLLLARSDDGKQKYEMEPHNISGLLAESAAEAELIAPDFTFEPEIEADFSIRCDGAAIRRVLRILLSNAVKYSGESRRVRLSARETHGLAYITVADAGIGISPEHLKRIFDRFYRVDTSRAKKTGGSGLGLAIAKEIVKAHGGEIKAVSAGLGMGTEFTVVLPV
jgi:signal transduction histidine kinase